MENEITAVRDQWITNFKNDWDKKIQLFVSKKNKNLNELELRHAEILEQYKLEKARELSEIELKWNDKICKLEKDKKNQILEIEQKHMQNLEHFIESNVKQNSMLDSVLSYIQHYFYGTSPTALKTNSPEPPPYTKPF